MTELEKYLTEVKRRAEVATKGPWKRVGESNWKMEGFPQVEMNDNKGSYFPVNNGTDADFIAHSRTDVPKLLEIIEVLIKQRNQWVFNSAGDDPELLDTLNEQLFRGEK